MEFPIYSNHNRQPKRYGTAIPLPCLGVSVTVSKVSRAAAPKGTQSCTTHANAGGGRGPRGEGAWEGGGGTRGGPGGLGEKKFQKGPGRWGWRGPRGGGRDVT